MSTLLITTTRLWSRRSPCLLHAARTFRFSATRFEFNEERQQPRRPNLHEPRQDLPIVPKRWPTILAVTIVGVSGWAAFLLYVTNSEKVSSSVVRQIMRTVQQNDELRELLGEGIRAEPAWYLNGEPRMQGQINTLQGNIDVSFRVRGTKGVGTLYFTSVRKAKGEKFTILRFKVIGENGGVVHLPRTSES